MSTEQREETLVQESSKSITEEKMAETSVSEGKPKATNAKQGPAGADPYIRNLLVIAALVIIGALLTMVFAVLNGVIDFNQDRVTNVNEFAVARAATIADADGTAGGVSYLAIALMNNNQMTEANALIQDALQMEWPDTERNQGVMFAYAVLADRQGDIDAAIERYEYVMDNLLRDFARVYTSDVEPNWARGFGLHHYYHESAVALAFIYAQKGDYEKQIEMLDIAISGLQTDADLFLFRGQAKLKLGDNEGAIADFNEVLRFLPNDEAALQGLEEAGGTVND